ncbi:MAG: rhodanese-like domain-containing protein [Proteobacteria bacterium]|nr:rhodanese-like domain-containing protein [Pseudomonadota bacterium]
MELEFVAANWYLFAAAAVILFLLFGNSLMMAINGIKSVNASEAVQLVNHQNGVIVDVCEVAEHQKGHIPGAINIPLSKFAARSGELEKHKAKPVVIVCRSGNRSSRAAITLRKKGFESVYNLSGGVAAWQRENLPMEK